MAAYDFGYDTFFRSDRENRIFHILYLEPDMPTEACSVLCCHGSSSR
jgi:hypothetical protein